MLTSHISYVPWFLASIITESSHCFWMQQKLRTHICVLLFAQNFGQIIIYSSTHCQELMKSVGVMAASLCYLWWRWWFGTLWVNMLILVMLAFVFLELNSVSFQVFVVEFYLQSHTYFLKKLLLLQSAHWKSIDFLYVVFGDLSRN